MTHFITRFAPSPTYYLHVGHGFSALQAWQAAAEEKGKFLLRIENIDQTRCRPAYEQAIYADMEWLNIHAAPPIRRQSDHLDLYQRALEKLRARGLLYRCFKTRRELANLIDPKQSGPDGPIYFGAALPHEEEQARLTRAEPFAWRLSLDAVEARYGSALAALGFTEQSQGPQGESGAIKINPRLGGDVVLARKDMGLSYHLASVVDDADQNISHVIRGRDLFYATHIHRLLQFLLNLPTPIYRHHRLITDEKGKKFSKSDHALTMGSLRQQGVTVAQMKERFF